MKKYRVNDINKFNINTETGNIILSSGEGIITIPDEYNAFINNGCVYIKEEKVEEKMEEKPFYPSSDNMWHSSSITIGNGKKIINNSDENIDIKLRIDEDYNLILRTSVGTIKINKLNIKKLIANSTAGSIILKDVYSENAIISTLIGDISLELNDSISNCDSSIYSMLGNTSKESIEKDDISSIKSSLMANSYTGNIKVLFKGRKLD